MKDLDYFRKAIGDAVGSWVVDQISGRTITDAGAFDVSAPVVPDPARATKMHRARVMLLGVIDILETEPMEGALNATQTEKC
jgi:hypothetical protein